MSAVTPVVDGHVEAPADGDHRAGGRWSIGRAVLTAGRSRHLAPAAVAFFAASGVAMRIWILQSGLGDADSDEAVTGLMAMHFLDGQFQALYWGATYAGTLEPLLTAALFAVVGPSTVALKAIPIAFTLLTSVLIVKLCRESFGSEHGLLAGAVYWVFPGASVLLLMKAQVVYASGACFIVILLLLALRMQQRPRPIHFVGFGFVAGLCLWATPLSFATVVPIALITAGWTWRRGWMNLLAVPGAVIGALPWLWYGATHDWTTLRQVGTVSTTYLERLHGGVFELYPLLLGLRQPLTGQWLVSPLFGTTIFVMLCVGMVVVPLRRFGTRALPMAVAFVSFPFLYAMSSTSWYWSEPRHGMFIAPVMVMLAVSLVPRPAVVQVATFCVLFALSASTIGFVTDLAASNPGLATVVPGKLAPVLSAMDDQGLDSCYADYWIAYRIDFESEEGIICAAYWGDRWPPYREYADGHGARTYLFIRQTPTAAAFRDRLDELRIPFTQQDFETVTMFVLDEPRRPDEINQCVEVPWLEQPTCPT